MLMSISISTVVGAGPFIPIEDATEMPRRGTMGRPGAIVIKVDGEEFAGPELWDEIDTFWPLFLNGVRDVSETGSGTSQWPDQWIKVIYSSFDSAGETYVHMRLEWEPEEPLEAYVKLADLQKAAGDAALVFFDIAERLEPKRFKGNEGYREIIAEWQSQDQQRPR